MKVITGSASELLAGRLAKVLGCTLVKPERKRFPDSETYLRIPEEVKGEHVIVVQSTSSPANDNLIELSLLLSAARTSELDALPQSCHTSATLGRTSASSQGRR